MAGGEQGSGQQAQAEAAALEERRCCASCRAVYRRAYCRCPRDGGELRPLTEDPLVGFELAGRYLIEECIGEGAMGRVYRARHAALGRAFAIKILFGDVAADEKMRTRFANEAEAASRLCHPNVVSTLDFGHLDDELPFLAMEYVPGRSLADVIFAEAPLSVERSLALARGICAGLGHAHERGLVHRDVKPLNILVETTPEGEAARVVDFGLAIAATSAGRLGRLTTVGMVIGTPTYMAPEQACDLPIDHRADLFSLGVVMYEMLAGVPPFDGTPMEIAHQNANATMPPLAARNPAVRVPPRVEAIVHRLLCKWPDGRFSCAGELLEALDGALTPSASPARAVVAPPAVPAWDRMPTLPVAGEPAAVAAGASGPPAAGRPRPDRGGNRGAGRRHEARLPLAATAVVMAAAMLVGGRLWMPAPPLRARPSRAGAPRKATAGAPRKATPPRAQVASSASLVLDLEAATGADAPAWAAAWQKRGGGARSPRPAKLELASLPRDPLSWLPPIARAIARRHHRRVAAPAFRARSRKSSRRTPAVARRRRRSRAGRARASRISLARRLARRYRETGEAVDQLARLRGDQAAAPYRRRFFAIRFGDALRSERSRRRALRALNALFGEVSRQLARTVTRRDPRRRR